MKSDIFFRGKSVHIKHWETDLRIRTEIIEKPLPFIKNKFNTHSVIFIDIGRSDKHKT